MKNDSTVVVTGAAGFIGSYMVGFLNRKGFENLILVDEFDEDEKELNLHQKKYKVRVERDDFFEWLEKENPAIDFVFHLGARTDTTEFDYSIHEKLNVEYSKKIWKYCAEKRIPLVYASSAATYGSGELGYKDDHTLVEKLQPLNPYGVSKNEFDKWVLRQAQANQPLSWTGLKFFNVYGPNEYHKARMASVVFHAFNQIKATGKVKLFRSHKEGYKDGEQLRDFIYVEDVCKVMYWMMGEMSRESGVGSRELSVVSKQAENSFSPHSRWLSGSRLTNGLYNLGTGKARTFIDLVTPIFTALKLSVNIEFIDIPEDIRDKYQYFTEADMKKLKAAGYNEEFFSVEKGVGKYVRDYLVEKRFY